MYLCIKEIKLLLMPVLSLGRGRGDCALSSLYIELYRVVCWSSFFLKVDIQSAGS